MYRELLNRLEVFVRQLRSSASASSAASSPAAASGVAEEKILPQLELLLQQIMQLVNR